MMGGGPISNVTHFWHIRLFFRLVEASKVVYQNLWSVSVEWEAVKPFEESRRWRERVEIQIQMADLRVS